MLDAETAGKSAKRQLVVSSPSLCLKKCMHSMHTLISHWLSLWRLSMTSKLGLSHIWGSWLQFIDFKSLATAQLKRWSIHQGFIWKTFFFFKGSRRLSDFFFTKYDFDFLEKTNKIKRQTPILIVWKQLWEHTHPVHTLTGSSAWKTPS